MEDTKRTYNSKGSAAYVSYNGRAHKPWQCLQKPTRGLTEAVFSATFEGAVEMADAWQEWVDGCNATKLCERCVNMAEPDKRYCSAHLAQIQKLANANRLP